MANSGVMGKLMKLPSDQDSSGRTLGDEEIARVAEAIRSGTLISTKGTFVKKFEQDFAQAHRREAFARVLLGHGGDPLRGRGRRSGARRRDRHHADHRHGGAHADPLPGCDPGVRRRRPAHLQRHRGDDRAASHAQHEGDHRHAPVRQPVRHEAPSWRSPTSAASRSSRTARRRSWRPYDGKPVGTIGAIGCFSLQQGKHITTGEGGLVVTNDEALAPPRVPVHQQGVGLRRPEPRPLLPRAELPHDASCRARSRRRSSPSSAERATSVRRAAKRLDEKLRGRAWASKRRWRTPAARTRTGSTACASTAT